MLSSMPPSVDVEKAVDLEKAADAESAHAPLASVIIPAFNSRPLIDAQLSALAEQTFDGAFEVLVSDNGSVDGLREHIEDHPLRSRLGMRYVDASHRTGASYARNVGVGSARADKLIFCDADDVVRPEWLATLVSALEDADVVGTAIEVNSLNPAEVIAGSPQPPPDKQGTTDFLPFAVGASFGCRATVFRELDGMSEDLHAAEDIEFSWRAQLHGYTFDHVPTALVSYRLRPDLKSLRRQAFRLGYGNAKLRGLYREQGAPLIRALPSLHALLFLVVNNPLLPSRIRAVPRPLWTRMLAANLGLLVGGVRYRGLRF